MKLRLDKYLADMGLGTRSQVKKAVSSKAVKVNGEVEMRRGRKLKPQDIVEVEGQKIKVV